MLKVLSGELYYFYMCGYALKNHPSTPSRSRQITKGNISTAVASDSDDVYVYLFLSLRRVRLLMWVLWTELMCRMMT